MANEQVQAAEEKAKGWLTMTVSVQRRVILLAVVLGFVAGCAAAGGIRGCELKRAAVEQAK